MEGGERGEGVGFEGVEEVGEAGALVGIGNGTEEGECGGGVAVNGDALIEDGGEPIGFEVVGVEVGEADGRDVVEAGADGIEASGGGAWSDADVDEK